MTAFVLFSWKVPFPLTVLDYYLSGSHYCSCCRHIQTFPSKMHQGVVAFIFCLAKVFIDVLRKSHKNILHQLYEEWYCSIHSIVYFQISITFNFLWVKEHLKRFNFLFVIRGVCQIHLPLVCPSDVFPAPRINSRGKTVENNSTISLTPLILGQPGKSTQKGYRKRS